MAFLRVALAVFFLGVCVGNFFPFVKAIAIEESDTFAGLLVAHEGLEAGASLKTAAEMFAETQGEELVGIDDVDARNVLVGAMLKVAYANEIAVYSLDLAPAYDSKRGIKKGVKSSLVLLKKAVIAGGLVTKKALIAKAAATGVAGVAAGVAFLAQKASTTTTAPSTSAASTTAASTTSAADTSTTDPSTSTSAPTSIPSTFTLAPTSIPSTSTSAPSTTSTTTTTGLITTTT